MSIKKHNYATIYELQRANKKLKLHLLVMVGFALIGFIFCLNAGIDLLNNVSIPSRGTIEIFIDRGLSEDGPLVPADELATLKEFKGEEKPSSPDIESKIREAFPEDADTAVKVALCESSLNPERIGDTHLAKPSIGLFQINQIWHDFDTETLLNVDENIKIARQIYDRSGKNWNRWTCGRMLAQK